MEEKSISTAKDTSKNRRSNGKKPVKPFGALRDFFTQLRVIFSPYSDLLSTRFLLWFFAVLVYVFTANFTLAGPNPSSRFVLIKTLAMTGQTWFPKEWLDIFWVSPDYAQIGDHYYSDKAPGLAILLLPMYFLAQLLGSLLGLSASYSSVSPVDKLAIELMQVFLIFLNAWGVVRVYDIAVRLGAKSRNALTVAYIFAFGTIFWAFSSTLFPHALAATILLEVTHRLLEIRDNEHPLLNALVIGVLLGFGGVIEYPIVFTVPLACMYLLVPFTSLQPLQLRLLKEEKKRFLVTIWKEDTIIKRLFLCFAMGLVSIAAYLPLLLYNLFSFGNSGNLAYQYSHWYDDIHFYNPLQKGLEVLVTSTFRGVLTFSPIILLSILGFMSLYKKHAKESLFMLVTGLFFIFFYAKNWDPAGGASFGPRYIIPALPFFILPLAFLMEDWDHNAMFSLALRMLAGFSIFFNFLGLWVGAYGPLIFEPYESSVHPVLDVCWVGLLKFLAGDQSSFRSALWRNNPITGMAILGLTMLVIFLLEVVILPRENKQETGQKTAEMIPLNNVETAFWFATFTFALVAGFYFVISPAMSTGYDAKLATLVDTAGFIKRPLTLGMLPVLDFLLIAALAATVLVTTVRLVQSLLAVPKIRDRMQSFVSRAVSRKNKA